MRKTLFWVVCILFIVAIALGSLETEVNGGTANGGCTTCHPKLSETVQKAKSLGGNYSATIHRVHYANLAGVTCSLCHKIDANANLQIIGEEWTKQIKVSPEKLASMEPYYKSWATSSFEDQQHGKRGVTCQQCHDQPIPETTVKKEKCLSCHTGSYEGLADQSPFHNDTLTPHFSPEPLECNLCHKAHRKSELACLQCHNVDAKMP